MSHALPRNVLGLILLFKLDLDQTEKFHKTTYKWLWITKTYRHLVISRCLYMCHVLYDFYRASATQYADARY